MHDEPTFRPDPPALAGGTYSTMFTLRALERLVQRPHSVPELAQAIGLQPRSCRRLLHRLRAEGFVVQDGGHRRRYRPTLRLAALGLQLLADAPLLRIAGPVLTALAHDRAGHARLWVAGAGGPVALLEEPGIGPWASIGGSDGADGPAVAVLDPARRQRRSCALAQDAGTRTVAAAVVDRGDVVAAVGLVGMSDGGTVATVVRAADELSHELAVALSGR